MCTVDKVRFVLCRRRLRRARSTRRRLSPSCTSSFHRHHHFIIIIIIILKWSPGETLCDSIRLIDVELTNARLDQPRLKLTPHTPLFPLKTTRTTASHQRHPRVRPGPRPRDNVPETVDVDSRVEWCRENDHNRVPKNGEHGGITAERAIRAGVYPRPKSGGRDGSESTDKTKVSKQHRETIRSHTELSVGTEIRREVREEGPGPDYSDGGREHRGESVADEEVRGYKRGGSDIDGGE
jgi:hypothetical protein